MQSMTVLRLYRDRLPCKLCRLFLDPLFNSVTIALGKIKETQTHAWLIMILALEQVFPDHLALATHLAWGLGRQGQFDEECFSRFTWFHRRDEQSSPADILGVTKECFVTVLAGYFLHDQRRPESSACVLLFLGVLGVFRFTQRYLLLPQGSQTEFSVISINNSTAF
jgi:hypothetical protein